MKYLIVVLICLMALVCFAQEPIPVPENEVPIVLMLTDSELKAILHYHETVQGMVQVMIENRAYGYMEQIAKEYRNMDLEAIINALPIKTQIEIIAEIEAEKEKEKEK